MLFIFGSRKLCALDLVTAVRLGWKQSPQLSAQNDLWQLSRRDRWRRFLFNEPQLLYSNNDDATAESWGLGLALTFPGKGFALASLNAAQEQAQKRELDARKYDLARSISQGYLDCASAKAQLKVQQDVVLDLQTLADTLDLMYQAGHSSQAETIGAKLQLSQARSDLRLAEDIFQSAYEKLQALLGNSVQEGPDSTFELPDDLDPVLLADIGPLSSDEGRSQSGIEVASRTKASARWAQLPDLNLSISGNHYHLPAGGPTGNEWTRSLGVSVTLPLFFPFYEMAEGSRTLAQSSLDLETARLLAANAIQDKAAARRDYKRNRTRLKELRDRDLVLAEALKESTFSAYKMGKLGFAELMLARKTWSDLKNQDIQLRTSIITAHLRCLDVCAEVTAH